MKTTVRMVLLLLLLLPLTAAAVTVITSSAQEMYESEQLGFRLQIPQGWVIQDEDFIVVPIDPNIEPIATLCLENEALPDVGGDYNCDAASLTDSIFINRFPDLQSRPEFQNESDTDSTIIPTTDDLVALWIQELQNESASQIRIENTTDINEFTKIVDMTYQYVETAGTVLPFDDFTYSVKSTGMYVLSQDRNTGYNIINNLAIPNVMNVTEHSPAVQEVFNSFELIE